MGGSERFSLTCCLALFASAGCAAPDAPDPKESASRKTESAIINGAIDTTHTAVVAVLGKDFACSGTIVQVRTGFGYVLTAAHCCNVPGDSPVNVVMGNDYGTGQAFPIVAGSTYFDPSFDNATGAFDFCMVKFAGANASTPTIALTSDPDGATVGMSTEIVGYGTTAPPPGGVNSKRRRSTEPLTAVTTSILAVSQGGTPADGGACEGDPGGPVLVTAGAAPVGQHVVAVLSETPANCEGAFTTASRVTSELGAGKFLTSYLADMPTGNHVDVDGGIELVQPDGGADSGPTNNDGGATSNDGGTSGGTSGTSGGTSGTSGTSGGNGPPGSAQDASAAGNDTASSDDGGCAIGRSKDASGSDMIALFMSAAAFVLVLVRRKRA